jgi:hypothetical protein
MHCLAYLGCLPGQVLQSVEHAWGYLGQQRPTLLSIFGMLFWQGLRTVEHVVDRRIVSPLLGAPRLGPCRIHVEAAYYRVGAQEVSAASRDAGLSPVSPG